MIGEKFKMTIFVIGMELHLEKKMGTLMKIFMVEFPDESQAAEGAKRERCAGQSPAHLNENGAQVAFSPIIIF